jgi:hypothetical protein
VKKYFGAGATIAPDPTESDHGRIVEFVELRGIFEGRPWLK